MKIRFDTLAIHRRIAEGGFTQVQSNTLVQAISEAVDMAVSDLATREDWLANRGDVLATRTEMAGIREDMKRLAEKIEQAGERLAAEQRAFNAEGKAAIAENKAAIAEAVQRQLVWTVATMIAVGGIIIAIMRLG